MKWLKLGTRILLGVAVSSIGVLHFTRTDFFIGIMPPYIPFHKELVILSGICEIVLGITLQIPALTRLSGYGLIALFIAVFPANLHMAMHTDLYPETSPTFLYWRLPFQGVLIAWAWWYTHPDKAVPLAGDASHQA
jgi:uncharacterized membrane protein